MGSEPSSIQTNLVEFREASFGYGDKMIVQDLSFSIDAKSRIALVAPNGAGKTTLLKLIKGELIAIQGEVWIERRARIFYFDQHGIHSEDLSSTPVEYLKSTKARATLGRFGIPAENHNREISSLSGGQKSRLSLARIYQANPDLLILDEPTNHLDLDTIDSLIEAIRSFDGGIICVSHNLYFLEQCGFDIYTITKGTLQRTTLT